MGEGPRPKGMSTSSRRVFVKAVVAGSGVVWVGCGDGSEDASTQAASSGSGGAGGNGSGGAGAVGGAGGQPAVVEPPEMVPESDAFPLGISSGDATGSDVVLWCRYAGRRDLEVAVYEMNGEDYVSELGPFPAAVEDYGIVHVQADGLIAGGRYRYAFFELESGDRVARSAIGRFRAPIADGALEPLIFGAVSCTDNSKPFDTLARAADRDDLDAFLFVGDNAYCDGCETLDEYRALYVEHWGKPEHRALRASTSLLMSWDDHEVQNDWNPETIDAQRLEDAFQAFFEHAPLRRVQEAPRRIWRSRRWGKTAEIFVLDCRSERRPSTILSGDPEYLSAEQLAWLKEGLTKSEAKFKLILNSVPITDMPLLWDAYSTDRWEGYGGQREEILSFIDDNAISGVVWVAGDFHLAFISKIGNGGGPGATQLEVLVGPGAQSPSPLAWTLQPPQFEWVTDTNNYAAFHLDPAAETLRVVHHDPLGAVLNDVSYRLS